MKQQLFEQEFRKEWEHFADQLAVLENRRSKSQPDADFAERYRKVCYLLALARDRQYSPVIIEQLNGLALRGHQQLYKTRSNSLFFHFVEFVAHGFPVAVRRNASLVLLGMSLFFLPAIGFGLMIYFEPDLAYSFFSPGQIAQFTEMYDPEKHSIMSEQRDSSDDLVMFGFYIRNNIGIGFQTFASGLLFGLGSLFYLIYNGLAIGGVAGYLSQLGYLESFWSFVVGHGAFELTAIGLAGASGMKLGFALISPGRRSRKDALKFAARDAIILVYGVFLFLVVAAFLEAFWSSSSIIPPVTKYIVGGILWVLVITYLVAGGRQRGSV